MDYGDSVAIYVPEEFERIDVGDDDQNNVDELEKDRPDDARKYYYVMQGGSEIVIPEKFFDSVVAVSQRAQLEKFKR